MDFELTEEQRAFVDRVADFARARVAPAAASIDQSGTFPIDLVREAFALGLASVTVARDQGGGGRDYLSYALAIEAVARASATLAVILAVQNSLVVEPLERFGTSTQKEIWLTSPRERTGDRRVCPIRGAGRFGRCQSEDGGPTRRSRVHDNR